MARDSMESFIKAWHQNFAKKEHAITYARSRGVSDQQIEQFRVGWSSRLPLQKDGRVFYVDRENSEQGFIIIPMFSFDGRAVGWISRSLTAKEYSKCTVETPEAVFMGVTPTALQAIWDTRQIYLVEGSFDFFPLQRLYPNTLCLTSANLSHAQDLFLDRFVNTVFLCLDSDKKGMAAAHYIKGHKSVYKSYIISILPYKDVNDAWATLGEQRFSKYVTAQVRCFGT